MESKISTKMVNLREIKKDHALLRNDFFKADPFLGVKLKGGLRFVLLVIYNKLIGNRDVSIFLPRAIYGHF